ncbi:MAG: hypothetical protein J3K34DRAFT_411082 [Monoraphidium minutum]|nr:MAG: hypothetical protein J3K34DRAFT_411082 [Monoraphidium minutum]
MHSRWEAPLTPPHAATCPFLSYTAPLLFSPGAAARAARLPGRRARAGARPLSPAHPAPGAARPPPHSQLRTCDAPPPSTAAAGTPLRPRLCPSLATAPPCSPGASPARPRTPIVTAHFLGHRPLSARGAPPHVLRGAPAPSGPPPPPPQHRAPQRRGARKAARPLRCERLRGAYMRLAFLCSPARPACAF